MISSYLSDMTA